jgi:hypothetical protein
MGKRSLMFLVAALAAGGAGTAAASDSGMYYFGELGQMSSGSDKSNFDANLWSPGSSISSSLTNASIYTLQLGYKFNPYAAIEGGYIGTASKEEYKSSGGTVSQNDMFSSVTGYKLVGVGMVPLGPFTLMGKLGVGHTHLNYERDVTVSSSAGIASTAQAKDFITFGAAAKYEFSNGWFLRGDIDSYQLNTLYGLSRRVAYTAGGGFQF